MMTTYQFWQDQASRFNKVVDYGSPITSWTSEMLKVVCDCDGDKIKAQAILNSRKKQHENN